MIENICKVCQTRFVKRNNPNRVYKYCSIACMGNDRDKNNNHAKVMLGKETWNKGMKGIQPWMNTSGLNTGDPWNKGVKGAQKAWNKKPDVFITCRVCGKDKKVKHAKLNRSKTCSRVCANNYKDKGKTPLLKKARGVNDYRKWRIAVLERDGHKCILCGSKNKIHADHIKRFCDYPKLRYDINNGRALCFDCHKKTDTYGNKPRVNGKQFQIALTV